MSNGKGRYIFAGHATGAAARFHRLDDADNLDHVVPVQGASAVPMSGGRSEWRLANPFRYHVEAPRKRCLLQVDQVATLAEGRTKNGSIETEVSAEVTGLVVLEKLYCDFLRMHMLATRKTPEAEAVVTTAGNRLDGLRLGDITVAVTFDETPLSYAGTDTQFAAWHKQAKRSLAKCGQYRQSSIVRDIQLIGDGPERKNMTVDGHMIHWHGFGRIYLGEIHVKSHERRLTLIRLDMGSDAGGDGSAGDGQSNGGVGN